MKNVVFSELFRESSDSTIYYNGKLICLSDKITLDYSHLKVRITFLSSKSNWRQGFCLYTKGILSVNNQEISNSIVLWEDTAPKEFDVFIHSQNRLLIVYNVWDTGDGVIHYGHNGAALYTEEISNGKTYYCNDGKPDDDFDDLIFKLEFLNNEV